MNNWFRLTLEQIEKIKEKYPDFDSDELEFMGVAKFGRFKDESLLGRSAEIGWLKVKILPFKWRSLIIDSVESGEIFELTQQQCDTILGSIVESQSN